ncbi:hypothetical protein QTO34_018410, partial [Cnephaeus nilssonii]
MTNKAQMTAHLFTAWFTEYFKPTLRPTAQKKTFSPQILLLMSLRTFIIHEKGSKINSNRNSEGVDFHPLRVFQVILVFLDKMALKDQRACLLHTAVTAKQAMLGAAYRLHFTAPGSLRPCWVLPAAMLACSPVAVATAKQAMLGAASSL